MIKAIALIKRKPGLSMDEFSRHYEEVHAPLALRHFPVIKRYVRNYVSLPPGAEELEFDCITEFWYENMEGLQAAIDTRRSEARQLMHDDEESFMDRSKMITFLVEEKVSEIQG